MGKIYQLTEHEFNEKRNLLDMLSKEAEKTLEDLKHARELGDLRENSEYDAAREKYSTLSNDMAQLSDMLENCEIVQDDNTPVIKIGSEVTVVELDDSNNKVGKKRTFTVRQNGDTVIQHVLSTTSPLGKAVLGKNSGVFEIVCNGKKRYHVEKVLR